MNAVTTSRSSGGYLERPSSASLADVIDSILDKGLVIDAFIRVTVVGIELVTIDARIVIASVDTYLRFAEATNRLDLAQTGGRELPEMMGDLTERGSQGKTKGILSGAKEALVGGSSGDDDKGHKDQRGQKQPQEPQRQAGKEQG